MGSSASKPAKLAAGTVSRRQYPKTPSNTTTTTSPSTTVRTSPSPAPKTASPPPSRIPEQPRAAPLPSRGPTYHSKEQPSNVKSEAIDLDGRDPDFAASLRSIGPVTPTPTLSNSSIFNRPAGLQQNQGPAVFPQSSNPALLVLAARQQITQAAEKEAEIFGRQSHTGREFLDALTIRQALAMRDRQGLPDAEIERLLRLKNGVMQRLGRKGVFEVL